MNAGQHQADQDAVRSLVLRDAAGEERVITLEGDVLRVGRDAACDIQIDSVYVSRQHARIERQGNDIVLVDLGSRNGTLINNERVEGTAVLHPGDVIEIADATLECVGDDTLDGVTRTLQIRRPARPAEAAAQPAAPPDRLRVDTNTYEVFLGERKLERRLSAQEFDLLAYLYTNRERVCQRAELGDAIWGKGNWDPNMLHRLVHRLKEKLEPTPEKPRYVQTVPWVGYRLTE